MYALVFYQIALLTECLITHFTSQMALTTMYAFVCYQTALYTECLITHFTSIRALTTMNAFVFYQNALFTEYLITHFTRISMLTPIYITGISAFRTVYMKLFIQSNLVKTQRLNFRIYSAERKIIFVAMNTLYKNTLYLKNCVIIITVY